MEKIKRHIIPIFSLLMYEILYFICEPYPKSLFDIRFIKTPNHYIIELPDTITKLVLLLIYISIINLICKYIFFNEIYFLKRGFFKDILMCANFLIPLRLVFDIIIFIPIPEEFSYAQQFIVDILYNFVVFLFIFRKKNLSIFKKRQSVSNRTKFNKKTLFLIFIMLLLTAIYIIMSVIKTTNNIEHMDYLCKKYSSISIIDEFQNIPFEVSLITLIFNLISVFIIYFIFYSMVEIKSLSNIGISKIIARIFSIIVLLVLLLIIKAFLAPKNLLYRFVSKNTETISYEDQKSYDKNEKNLTIYRSNGYNKYDTIVYSKSTVYITFGNKTMAKIRYNNSQLIGKIIDYGNEIFSYDTQAIMYMESNKPVCILSKDINKHEKSNKLTHVLEMLIDSGSFEFLEYSYDYMLKYDKEYMERYLKSYSQGNYNEEKNKNIEREYIIEYSRSALKNDWSNNIN